ncbi:histidine phosphatase family protein, partial [bacterium]|nr:histidine phosphatase family protein [bacterium]
MSQQTLMYLIRHGATLQNEHRPVILQGNGIDGPLSPTGQKQANEVAEALVNKKIQAVYASPMKRAQQTAIQVAERHSLAVQTIPEIHEVDVGEWEGKTWIEIMENDRELYNAFMSDPTCAYRGGESFHDVLNRVQKQFDRLLQEHQGETIAVVAHNVVNRVYLASLLYG